MYKKIIERLSRLTGYSETGIIKYYSNTMWLFGERVVSMLIGLTVGIAVARYLGPHDYGVMAYGLTLYAMALSFSTLGIDDLVIRDVLNSPKDEGRIFGTAFIFRSVAAVICFIGFFIFAFLTTETGYLLPVLLIMSAVLIQPVSILSLYFRMIVKSKFAASAVMVAYVLSSMTKIIMIYIGAPLTVFAVIILVDSVVQVALLVYFYKKRGSSFTTWVFDKSIALYFVKQCWPLALIVVFSSIYNKIDIIFINKLMGSDDVGIYSVAVRLTEVWYHIPNVLAASVFPAIISAKKDHSEYKSRLSRILLLMTFMGMSFGIFVTFASEYIIKLLYGNAYADAAPVLAIFCWGLLFLSFNVVTMKWILAENYLLLWLYRVLASIVTGITLSYFLIINYGIKGAAAAAVINGLISSYFLDLCSSKTRYLFVLKTKCIFFPFVYVFRVLNSKPK